MEFSSKKMSTDAVAVVEFLKTLASRSGNQGAADYKPPNQKKGGL
jgi:hypothetical protein